LAKVLLKDGNKSELMLYEKWGIYGQLGVLLNNREGIKKLPPVQMKLKLMRLI